MLNKRGEMYNSVKRWLQDGGVLDLRETAEDLAACEYKVRVDEKIVLEDKESIKARMGRSPCCGDALALTFAFPVHKRNNFAAHQAGKAVIDFDPYAM